MNQLVHDLAVSYESISLEDFVIKAKAAACPDLDTSFMAYFFELADEKNDGQFVVPHEKIVEYGVATSGQGSDMEKRFDRLGLLKDQESLVRHMSEQLKSGKKYSNAYLLTPDAFKSCLLRAQRRVDQPADSVKYASYYLFLEKVVKYFSLCERARLEHRDKILGNENMDLRKDIRDIKTTNLKLLESNNELEGINRDQTQKIGTLLEHAVDSKQQIAELHDKLDAMSTFTTEFARMTLPMWIGSNVFRTQLDQLAHATLQPASTENDVRCRFQRQGSSDGVLLLHQLRRSRQAHQPAR